MSNKKLDLPTIMILLLLLFSIVAMIKDTFKDARIVGLTCYLSLICLLSVSLWCKSRIRTLNDKIRNLNRKLVSLSYKLELLQTQKSIHTDEIKDLYDIVLKSVDDGK